MHQAICSMCLHIKVCFASTIQTFILSAVIGCVCCKVLNFKLFLAEQLVAVKINFYSQVSLTEPSKNRQKK